MLILALSAPRRPSSRSTFRTGVVKSKDSLNEGATAYDGTALLTLSVLLCHQAPARPILLRGSGSAPKSKGGRLLCWQAGKAISIDQGKIRQL